MTMQFSVPLQRAIFEILLTDSALMADGVRVFDDAPHRSRDSGRDAYITLGDEAVAPWNTSTEPGAVHDVTIRIYAPKRGFLPDKTVAAQTHEALMASTPVLSRGRIVRHEFIAAKSEREAQGALRRIDLTYRFVIEDVAAT